MQHMKSQRNSNLELYRIIVMMLIVAHHYVVNSGLIEQMQSSTLTANSMFLYLFGMWGKYQLLCLDYRLFYVQVADHRHQVP